MENFISKISFYLDHPFKNLIKTVLLFGSIMLIVYFSSINFIPLGDFKSLMYVIMLLAIMGIVFLSILLLSFYMAPVVWENLLKDDSFCKIILRDMNLQIFKNNNERILLIRKDPKYQGKIVLYYALSVLCFQFSIILFNYFNYEKIAHFIVYFSIVSVGLSTPFIFQNETKDISESKISIKKNKTFMKFLSVIKFPIFSSAAAFYLLVPTLILHSISDNTAAKAHDLSFDILFLIIIAVLSGTSLIIPANIKNLKLWGLVVSFLIVCHALLTLDITSTVSGNIIRFYKLGAMNNVNIAVDEEGCEIFEAYHFSINCGTRKIYEIKSVNLLWRVGEAFVEFTDKNKISKYLIMDVNHLKGIESDVKQITSKRKTQ